MDFSVAVVLAGYAHAQMNVAGTPSCLEAVQLHLAKAQSPD